MRTEQPPTVLAGRYALEQELGTSGTGTSWSATDTVLDRRVVVKLISQELVRQPAFAERLDLELRMVALASHRGLARLLDTGRDDGIAFIVRELVEGDSARTLIARDDTVPVWLGSGLVRGALDAIAAAHEAGVLHLDLKPENVFQCMDGTIRVSDLGFGEAVVLSLPPPEAMEILRPAPMAPETAAGGPPDVRTDVWATGALLYEVLIGRPPASGDDSPRNHRSDVTRKLDDVVRRALAPEPDDRFATAVEFGAALRDATGRATERMAAPARRSGPQDTAVVAPAPTAPPRPSIIRTWLVVPLLVVLIAAIALGAGLWLGKLEVGGPVGIRPAEENSAPATRVLEFKSVAAVDPYGDGHENDSGLPLVDDDDPLTAWKSENYFDGTLNKAGMGMLFDFEARRTVTGFRLQTPYPGYRFAVVVGNDLSAMIASARPSFTATDDMRDSIEPATGRYVLLWITTVVPTDDGNRAEVGEFEVVGPA
ncbi:MAG TPA: serine/threonine-protein kinase [Actinomycetota bacterium]